MYQCMSGHRFERPMVTRESNIMPDGYRETLYLLRCPVCGMGENYFDWIEKTESDDDENSDGGNEP